MATKYEEMCNAVVTSQRNIDQYRDHCWNYLATLYNGFVMYSGVPQENITFLKWNGSDDDLSQFSQPENGEQYTLQGAAVLGEDGFWRLGVRIFLKPMATVWFAFFVAEQNGHPVVKIGDKTFNPDLQNADSRNEVYEEIISRIKDAFSFPKKVRSKSIGFTVESLQA